MYACFWNSVALEDWPRNDFWSCSCFFGTEYSCALVPPLRVLPPPPFACPPRRLVVGRGVLGSTAASAATVCPTPCFAFANARITWEDLHDKCTAQCPMTLGGRPGRFEARLERKFALPFGAMEQKPARQQSGMQNLPIEFNLREAVDAPSGSSMVADLAGRSGPRRLTRNAKNQTMRVAARTMAWTRMKLGWP